MYLVPAASGWNLVRFAAHNGAWEVRGVATLDEAAALLGPDEDFVLGLPLSAVLAQRLTLPTVEPEEFGDMVRLQIEKTLPYSPDEVTTDFDIISQSEEGSVISAVAIHNERLNELAAPLLTRGLVPSQVTVYAAQRVATHAASGTALFLYPEPEGTVCAISEGGRLSFTRTLNGADEAQLQRELPQLALSAELQGIDTSAQALLLDESLYEFRDTLQSLFSTRADLIAVEAPPSAVKLNLLPEAWKAQRIQLVRLREWKKRLLLAGAIYAGLLLLVFAYFLVLRFRLKSIDRQIARDEPKVQTVKKTEARWKALAPAIDARYYPIEVLLHLFESLPSVDVRITGFTQSARQISVDGEATSAGLAYQFADKVKKNPGLQAFQFDMAAPRILPNEHAQFKLEGKSK
ncbi:MAG: hypothetical protein M3Z64_11455 [Verrucomicrobiota bacterium]|nr:hypothetical protein [Verrucomicrobiota bacterium]